MDTFFDDFKVKCDEISAKGILKLKKFRIDRAGGEIIDCTIYKI